MKKIDILLEKMNEQTKEPSLSGNRDSDRALYSMLKYYKDKLPDLDDYFHKSFRQTDIIDDDTEGTTDYVIWLLLCQSKLFWELYKEVVKLH